MVELVVRSEMNDENKCLVVLLAVRVALVSRVLPRETKVVIVLAT